jgi:flagellar motor switch protein FliM
MVNAPATFSTADRRERSRNEGARASVLGVAKLNPFGDLHSVQHLSARLARALRSVFEPVLRTELRIWAEPLVVQRFADYRAERPDALTAWLPLAMSPADGTALLVLDGRFVLEMLDLFFGGTGSAPAELPADFSPAAAALVARLGGSIADQLAAAWEPLARIAFVPGHVEANPALLGGLDADEAVIVTRFGIAKGAAKPVFLDICYPVAAMKPHGQALTGKVVARAAEPDAAWRTALTRAAMEVRFPVRSVLAEPVVSLSLLMSLKPGDIIPIAFAHDVPVMVGTDCLGTGTVGTSNGRAAIRMTSLASPEGSD